MTSQSAAAIPPQASRVAADATRDMEMDAAWRTLAAIEHRLRCGSSPMRAKEDTRRGAGNARAEEQAA